jgi:endonuclease/exonuclease/phosphatase family metal-dependent hydrolase
MRVLSYNIHKAIGGRDRKYVLRRVIDVIEHENPDFVCLQEVDRNVARSHHDDQPKLFTEHFNAAAHLYQLNVRLKSGGYGNLLLSRWPMASHHQISLRLHMKKPRGAQIATISTPEGPFTLVNVHLGLSHRERIWQLHHLLGHHLFTASGGHPSMIIGDYNDWRNVLADGPLVEHGFRQITSPPSRYRSFPAYLAMGSLDKAFARGDISVKEVRVVRTALAKDASDHLPLVIDFHLKEG